MKKRTKKLQITKQVAYNVLERDNHTCLFCKLDLYMPEKIYGIGLEIKDIAHVIGKAQGGLGTEKNLLVLCRYHHSLYDNGNKGLRKDMYNEIIAYLTNIYGEWDKSQVVYKKYQ